MSLARIIRVAVSAVLVADAARAQTPADRVQFGVTVSRDTVTVGEPFIIRVRVKAPLGATIRFPDQPDTSAAVQARDPRVIQVFDSVKAVDHLAAYTVAAWDVGKQRAVFGDVVVTLPGGAASRRIPITDAAIVVRTVLPADSTLRVPKPARPLWEPATFPWWLVALAVVLLAFAIWWWRRRRARPSAPLAVVVDPYDKASKDFERIEAMGLVDAGERTRFVSLVVEVLRDYLAARYSDAQLALTSRELIGTLRRRTSASPDSLARVLHEADLAKFAGMSLTEERARNVARDARSIVDKDHTAAEAQAIAQVAA